MGGYKGKTAKVKVLLPDPPDPAAAAAAGGSGSGEWDPAAVEALLGNPTGDEGPPPTEVLTAAKANWETAVTSLSSTTAQQYEALTSYAKAAVMVDPDVATEAAATAEGWLWKLPTEQAVNLAETGGFVNAAAADPKALKLWLHPHATPKVKNQIELAAAGQVDDQLLGKLIVDPASLDLGDPTAAAWIEHEPWPATDADLVELAGIAAADPSFPTVCWVEARTLTAVGPSAAAKQAVLNGLPHTLDGDYWLDEGDTEKFASLFGVPADDVLLLDKTQLTKLARPATSAAETAGLVGVLEHRRDLVDKLRAKAAAAADVTLAERVDLWRSTVSGCAAAGLPVDRAATAVGSDASRVIAPEGWAETLSLKDLRAAAELLGAPGTQGASRTAVQGWLGAYIDAPASGGAKLAQWNAKLAVAPADTVKLPQVHVPTAVGTKLRIPAPSQVARSLAASVRASAAAAAAVPAYQATAPSFVGSPKRATGTLSTGSHTAYELTADDDGGTWFAKPYVSAGKSAAARTEAEAAASKLRAKVVPTIPVYATEVGGRTMAVQPVIDAKPVAGFAAPTQTDVDQIVAAQVGDWLVGDHDGHARNWLRTTSGALIRCDVGQAFKHAADPAETLDPDWDPNAQYNDAPPAFKAVLRAHKQGTLPEGVRVDVAAALGPLRKAERLSDAEVRDTVRAAADLGAADPATTWREPLRQQIAARDGVAASQVSDAQVADEFVERVVARKRSLRDDLRNVFVSAGLDASALDVT